MNVQSVVEKLGFRPTEARVYVALMSLQEATVSDLARKIGIPRTTVQGILEDLYERGLITCYTSRRRKVWCAEHPRKLLARHQQLERHLNDLIPALERMRSVHVEAAKTFVYEGRAGVRFILDDILATRERVSIMGNVAIIRAAVGEGEWERFMDSAAGHIPSIRVVGAPVTEAALVSFFNIVSSAQWEQHTRTVVCLYGSRVAVIHDLNGVPSVTLMHNTAVHDLLMTAFACAWSSIR